MKIYAGTSNLIVTECMYVRISWVREQQESHVWGWIEAQWAGTPAGHHSHMCCRYPQKRKCSVMKTSSQWHSTYSLFTACLPQQAHPTPECPKTESHYCSQRALHPNPDFVLYLSVMRIVFLGPLSPFCKMKCTYIFLYCKHEIDSRQDISSSVPGTHQMLSKCSFIFSPTPTLLRSVTPQTLQKKRIRGFAFLWVEQGKHPWLASKHLEQP